MGFAAVGLVAGGVKVVDSSVLDESIPFSGDSFLKTEKMNILYRCISKGFQSETIQYQQFKYISLNTQFLFQRW